MNMEPTLQTEQIGELSNKGGTNMNSLKNVAAVATHATLGLLGARGNTGSIVADFLLSEGRKVRVVGRDAARLQRFVIKGAEAFMADVSDAAALTKHLRGSRAAYLMLP